MNLRFALRHARRESRSSWRRVGLYMGSITLGVAALVAINSFRRNISTAIQAESRDLLGADLELHANRAFPDPVQGMLDSAAAAGVPISYITSMPSMAVSDGSERPLLVQLRAVTGGFPYYGEIGTDPGGAWARLGDGRNAVVDRGVTVQLDLAVGDTLRIGESSFRIIGVITSSPGEVSFQTAIGPRVFIPGDRLAETGLVQFGSLVRYQAFLQIPENTALQQFLNRNNELLRSNEVRYDTVAEQVEELTEALGDMTRFLGLVGLTALLLGGVGVASAIHVFIKQKYESVAVLRCLGATQRTVFVAYLLQAGALGLAGSAVGVVLGFVVQFALPGVLGGFLPVTVEAAVDWVSVGVGLTIGLWVSLMFALLPLLSIRDVTPLRALRRELVASSRGRRGLRLAAGAGLVASVFAISVWQAPNPMFGIGYAGSIVGTTGLLWLTARLLIKLTRRFFPRRARYVVRQGISNLFRPQNQTVSVTIALGFGVFLIATIYLVQRNLLDRLSMSSMDEAPNIFLFDVQAQQRDGVERLLATHGAPAMQLTPLIPSRISHLNGVPLDTLMEDWTRSRWPLRREYRHTYRDTITATEELIEGDWWDATETPPDGVGRVSIEEDIARELGVGLGDRITWNVQGIPVETEIVNMRRVNWARFEPNFFFVFEPRALADAPQTIIGFTRIDDTDQRARFQRDLIRQFPNVSAIDLALLQNALNRIIGRVTLAIRFMALFSIASGVIVLLGAIATSRYHRIREGVLLKTLGASKRQIRQILVTEYAALGSLAGLTGIALAGIAGWALVTFVFELEYAVPAGALAGLWVLVVGVTTAIGVSNGGEVIRKPPLAVIRETAE